MINNFICLLSEHSGFGLNTDLFETNVLNLAFVIGVLIYYGSSLFICNVIVFKIWCFLVLIEMGYFLLFY